MTPIAKPPETDTSLGSSHQGAVVEIGPLVRGAEPRPEGSAPPSSEVANRGDVDASIRAIEHAGSFINALNFQMRTYEKIIRGLNETLAEQKASEARSHQQAIQAEARAKDAEEQIERLERREQAAQEHLDRAIKAIDTSFVFQTGFASRGSSSRA
ncbi:hypothetical protein [Beijerinckia sp. L45]|uniref:hypothetical protein n=1 Tax=Beijerinckia sp. L45 TaxID=1641855 RepID=UPI00131D33B6|nr:hypothetical protein [Beijerinckia sp. L45]